MIQIIESGLQPLSFRFLEGCGGGGEGKKEATAKKGTKSLDPTKSFLTNFSRLMSFMFFGAKFSFLVSHVTITTASSANEMENFLSLLPLKTHIFHAQRKETQT